jgi:hypothetical protein
VRLQLCVAVVGRVVRTWSPLSAVFWARIRDLVRSGFAAAADASAAIETAAAAVAASSTRACGRPAAGKGAHIRGGGAAVAWSGYRAGGGGPQSRALAPQEEMRFGLAASVAPILALFEKCACRTQKACVAGAYAGG